MLFNYAASRLLSPRYFIPYTVKYCCALGCWTARCKG